MADADIKRYSLIGLGSTKPANALIIENTTEFSGGSSLVSGIPLISILDDSTDAHNLVLTIDLTDLSDTENHLKGTVSEFRSLTQHCVIDTPIS